MNLLWTGLYHAFAMFWATLWALMLGFGISAALQVFVSKEQNWFFRVIHHTVGEVRLIVKNEGDVIRSRDVLRCHNYKLVPRKIAFE